MEILKKVLPINLMRSDMSTTNVDEPKNIYDFKVKTIDGEEIKLDKYKDKVLIISNVASQCGFTNSNYKQFQELYNKYADKGFSILAFPCNQFARQEPATECQIKDFSKKYDVTFDMFSKIDVNGSNTEPLFQYLKKAQNGLLFDAIKWNFTKFLINKEGVPVKRYAPNVEPLSIEKDIVELLEAK
ncbi:uncharacterized protein LOC135928264 [Gordionus sp. m RMFG-2023]|uniref:uncharacterized protein LOC135928264 n=1 Tax=Gordionus sp. m RMFG-2023 TaxID=3053472 RepID=UPI0031FE2FAF